LGDKVTNEKSNHADAKRVRPRTTPAAFPAVPSPGPPALPQAAFALIPAGGKSARMGKPKLALPLRGKSVLEHVIAALERAGIDRILVVINHQVPVLAELAAAAGAETLVLANETEDMRATVERGLEFAERKWSCRHGDPWLLVPADHPTLNPETVRLLLQAFRSGTPSTIIIPTHRGKRGHPCLLTWQHVEGIRNLAPGVGINSYLRDHHDETWELPMTSPDILVDLDSPEDYQRLLEEGDRGMEHAEI
jgi:molybdenum cofactor cytidylyltransferase